MSTWIRWAPVTPEPRRALIASNRASRVNDSTSMHVIPDSRRTVASFAPAGLVSCGGPQSEAKREAILSRVNSSYPYTPTPRSLEGSPARGVYTRRA
jgi:hypothetical protein